MLKRLLMIIFLLLVLVVIPQGKAHAAPLGSACPGSSSPYTDCDNQDAHQTGCAGQSYQLGPIGDEDYQHLQIWWSYICSTNFAEIRSPDGYPLDHVELERAQQLNTNCNVSTCTWNDWNSILTCSVPNPCGTANDYLDPNKIPVGATTWETNMLYAPNQQVRVFVYTQCRPGSQPRILCAYFTKWH